MSSPVRLRAVAPESPIRRSPRIRAANKRAHFLSPGMVEAESLTVADVGIVTTNKRRRVQLGEKRDARSLLPFSSRCYFFHVESRAELLQSLAEGARRLGASVSEFFDNNITHVVTDRKRLLEMWAKHDRQTRRTDRSNRLFTSTPSDGGLSSGVGTTPGYVPTPTPSAGWADEDGPLYSHSGNGPRSSGQGWRMLQKALKPAQIESGRTAAVSSRTDKDRKLLEQIVRQRIQVVHVDKLMDELQRFGAVDGDLLNRGTFANQPSSSRNVLGNNASIPRMTGPVRKVVQTWKQIQRDSPTGMVEDGTRIIQDGVINTMNKMYECLGHQIPSNFIVAIEDCSGDSRTIFREFQFGPAENQEDGSDNDSRGSKSRGTLLANRVSRKSRPRGQVLTAPILSLAMPSGHCPYIASDARVRENPLLNQPATSAESANKPKAEDTPTVSKQNVPPANRETCRKDEFLAPPPRKGCAGATGGTGEHVPRKEKPAPTRTTRKPKSKAVTMYCEYCCENTNQYDVHISSSKHKSRVKQSSNIASLTSFLAETPFVWKSFESEADLATSCPFLLDYPSTEDLQSIVESQRVESPVPEQNECDEMRAAAESSAAKVAPPQQEEARKDASEDSNRTPSQTADIAGSTAEKPDPPPSSDDQSREFSAEFAFRNNKSSEPTASGPEAMATTENGADSVPRSRAEKVADVSGVSAPGSKDDRSDEEVAMLLSSGPISGHDEVVAIDVDRPKRQTPVVCAPIDVVDGSSESSSGEDDVVFVQNEKDVASGGHIGQTISRFSVVQASNKQRKVDLCKEPGAGGTAALHSDHSVNGNETDASAEFSSDWDSKVASKVSRARRPSASTMQSPSVCNHDTVAVASPSVAVCPISLRSSTPRKSATRGKKTAQRTPQPSPRTSSRAAKSKAAMQIRRALRDYDSPLPTSVEGSDGASEAERLVFGKTTPQSQAVDNLVEVFDVENAAAKQSTPGSKRRRKPPLSDLNDDALWNDVVEYRSHRTKARRRLNLL